ncbi:hypothetical protein CEXT_640911 [Caerostris extrusa]|uniref:Uncharacterized protein n=1 Tax=Caerostris extrusa TaxID=172846 RepID=A0AAV4MWW0_CAEEX|nr:hypothetical protein CEXT_640911 [Caerostris extrusa]
MAVDVLGGDRNFEIIPVGIKKKKYDDNVPFHDFFGKFSEEKRVSQNLTIVPWRHLRRDSKAKRFFQLKRKSSLSSEKVPSTCREKDLWIQKKNQESTSIQIRVRIHQGSKNRNRYFFLRTDKLFVCFKSAGFFSPLSDIQDLISEGRPQFYPPKFPNICSGIGISG